MYGYTDNRRTGVVILGYREYKCVWSQKISQRDDVLKNTVLHWPQVISLCVITPCMIWCVHFCVQSKHGAVQWTLNFDHESLNCEDFQSLRFGLFHEFIATCESYQPYGIQVTNIFWMETSACSDETLKNQPNKIKMTPQHFYSVATFCAILHIMPYYTLCIWELS